MFRWRSHQQVSTTLERMKMINGYEIFEHKHKFSVWAAARATQRGFTNVDNLKEALEDCGIVEFIKDPESFEIDEDEFKKVGIGLTPIA